MLDLIVEVIHGIPGVSHPEFAQPLWALGLIPQIRFPEASKGVIPCLVRSGVRVHVPKLLQSRMEVATQNAR
jgi:hypothetical protein